MAELATLGIEVQATDVDQASQKLDKLTGAAKLAEAAVEGLGPTSSKAGQMAAQAANATATALKAETVAATKAAGAMRLHAQAANQNNAVVAKTHDTANLAAQGFDIVTTAAGGMSAGLIGMQQGLQIAQVAMASGGGFARSLGAAFLGMLSPVTLLSVGLTTLAAVAIQALVGWFSKSEETNLSLEKQGQLLSAVAERWGAVAPSIKAYADELERVKAANDALAAGDIVSKAQFAGAQAALSGVSSEYERMIAVLNAKPDTVQFANDMTAAFQNLVQKLSEGKATSEDVKAAQDALSQAMTTGAPEVIAFGNAFAGIVSQIYAAVGAMVDARNEAGRVGAAMNAALNNPAYWRGAGNVGSGDGPIQGSSDPDLPLDGPTPGRRPTYELGYSGMPSAKKSGGGGGSSAYDSAVKSMQGRINEMQAETAAQAALNPTVNDYGRALAAAKAEAQLLSAAEADKKKITPQLAAEIKAQAAALGEATAAQNRQAEATKAAQKAIDDAKGTVKGFISDLRTGLQNGEGFWKSFGKAASNVLDKIIGKIEDELVNALFSASSAGSGASGGGFLSSIFGGIGKLFGFATGGYTGNGAASQAAGIVHGGEYVFSKKATDRIGVGNLEAMHKSAKGYASGGYVAPVRSAANSNSSGVLVQSQIGVTVDDDGKVQAYVKKESTSAVDKATPGIVSKSVGYANQTAPSAVSQAQDRQIRNWRQK